MNKFFLYLRTKEFRKNLLIAFGSVLGFVIVIYFCLDIYTRHGQSMPVPKLKGLQASRAIQMLEDMGLEYSIDSVYQADQPPGTVVDQDPDPNTNVKTNRTIYLTIITSQAPNVAFPDIVDKTYVEVASLLASYGLKVGDTIYQPDIARDRVLQARIAGQAIRTGESVPKGSRISLILGNGKGSAEVEIPNLKGLTLGEVSMALAGAQVTLGNVIWQGAVKDSLNAIIINQIPNPADTSKMAIGGKIDVVVTNEGQ